MFPVFAKAREKARQSSCLSNVKQLVLATLQYGQDYDEQIPCTRPIYRACANNSVTFFNHAIYPYVKNSQVFLCPSLPTPASTCAKFTNEANAMALPTTYGLSCKLGQNNGIALATIQSPSQLYYIACGTSGWGWWRGFKAANNTCTANQYYKEVHNGGINIGFADGHAKWVNSGLAFADAFNDWNTLLPWAPAATQVAPGR